MNRQQGFGAIAAIFIVVILAALAAAIVSISTTQQVTSAQDVMSARAWQAARAGNEWGLYKAFRDGVCVAAPGNTLDLGSDSGFHVTVECDSHSYYEGDCDFSDTTAACVPHPTDPARKVRKVLIYAITAVACPAATCPVNDASAAGIGYIQRTRMVLATDK